MVPLRRMWRATVVLVAFAAIVGVGACAREDRTPRPSTSESQVSDDGGRVLPAGTPRARIVSVIPAVTDLILALGAADRLVARTRYDLDPRLSSLPSLGGGIDPSLEAITALHPDLVIAWPDKDLRSVTGRLDEIGVPVYAAAYAGLADFERHALALGRLLGLEGAADSLIESVSRGLSDVSTAVAGAARPSVFYVVGIDPVMTVGPGTFTDSLITMSGGANLFADASMGWPQVGLEEVVRRNPDVVVFAMRDGDAVAARPGWRDLEAVRRGRVLTVDPDLFNRPGPNLLPAARILAAALHPSRFTPR